MDFSLAIQNIPLKPIDSNSYTDKNIDKTESTKEAFQSFEAMFISSMLSDMTKSASMDLSGKKQGMGEEWIWTMMAQTISEELAQGEGMGLSKLLIDAQGNQK